MLFDPLELYSVDERTDLDACFSTGPDIVVEEDALDIALDDDPSPIRHSREGGDPFTIVGLDMASEDEALDASDEDDGVADELDGDSTRHTDGEDADDVTVVKDAIDLLEEEGSEAIALECPDDAILACIDIETELAKLDSLNRDVVVLAYAYEQPSGYVGPWPPTLEDIGEHVGRSLGTEPIGASAVANRLARIRRRWREAAAECLEPSAEEGAVSQEMQRAAA